MYLQAKVILAIHICICLRRKKISSVKIFTNTNGQLLATWLKTAKNELSCQQVRDPSKSLDMGLGFTAISN
jgi:hypothetical protein